MKGRDAFRIGGPALISFSGGRTSAYMLRRILEAHDGILPPDVKVTFANTGKEMPQTLDFVRDCGERWAVDVVWLEYRDAEAVPDRWARVTYETASRNGEPFKALINRKGFLPNPVTRFCTSELKVRPMRDYARSLGWESWTNVLGLRADEPSRVARSRVNREAWDNAMPLATAGITKRDVSAYWAQRNFGLRLPDIGGVTPLGNCDLCFLKSAATISGIMRDMPERAEWWIEAEAEAEARASKPLGAFFRADRPSYAAMLDAVKRQQGFDFGDRDEIVDCMCGEAA
jgi:3'-phosphoadenosine 5'-phosphosulfate sulfotransferase (PAPS reductase)/FAD synthetase